MRISYVASLFHFGMLDAPGYPGLSDYGTDEVSSAEPIPVSMLLTRILLVMFVLAIAGLVVASIRGKGNERWVGLLFTSILLLGFSALSIFSIGLFLALPALALLVLSLVKLLCLRRA